MTHLNYMWDLIQGTDEWHQARLGLLTASEMKNVITPTLKIADNKDTRTHLYKLVDERASQYLEDHFESYDMMRGKVEEIYAKDLYSQKIAQVKDCGFITNNRWGFTLGFSPDGMVGDDGMIEIKSRAGKYQVQTIIDDVVPKEHIIQVQTGLLISERKWCDFISYSNGRPMFVKRVLPDEKIQSAIEEACHAFEKRAAELLKIYVEKSQGMIQTERRDYETGSEIKPSEPSENVTDAASYYMAG